MPVPPVIQMYRYVMGSGGGVSNLLQGSEELGSTGVGRWNRLLMNAVNSNQVNNPEGTEQTADQLDFQADKKARIEQDVTLVAGTEYTFSVWARAASGTQDFRLSYWDNVGRNFGTSAHTASATWSPTTGRYSFTFTAASSGTFSMFIQNATDNATRRIYFWGAMLNVGATAADYVKTTFIGPSSPATPPMEFGDNFAGVTAYYSLRRFTRGANNNAIRVRRSSDDTEQDFGFDANGALDTTALTTFVNEEYDHYTSNWAAGVDGWTVNNAGGGTVTLSNDTNRLKVDVSGMTTTALRPALNFPATIWSNITEGCSATITIEGSNLVVDGLFVDGTFQNITDHDLDTGTFTYTFTKAASNTAIIYFNSTGKGDYVGFLESVVITQTTADGAVTTWYDQTGNGNDATNSTESEQPLVVSAGTLVEENSKAAIDFDGVDDYFTLGGTNDAGILGDISVFSVNKNSISGNSVIVSTGLMASSFAPNMQWGINGGVGGYTGTTSDGTTRINEQITTANYGSQVLVSMINDEDGNLQLFADGVGSTGQTAVAPMNDANFALEVGRDSGDQRYYFEGTQQELILFASDQSANRGTVTTGGGTLIEGNINTYFDIV